MTNNFEVGKLYPIDQLQALLAMQVLGEMRMMASGVPDLTRGRRYMGSNTWDFWMTSGQRVSVAFIKGGGSASSITSGADKERPERQFPYKPTKCIKPDCNNLVAPISTPPDDGHFKNYRSTGACEKSHSTYFCGRCGKVHSYTTRVGVAHYEFRQDV